MSTELQKLSQEENWTLMCLYGMQSNARKLNQLTLGQRDNIINATDAGVVAIKEKQSLRMKARKANKK